MYFGDDDNSIALGPDTIIKQFMSKKACRKTLIGAVMTCLMSLVVIAGTSFGIFLLISKVLEPWASVPHYVNIIFSIGLFFFLFWPVACFIVIATAAAGLAITAIRGLIREDFLLTNSTGTDSAEHNLSGAETRLLESVGGIKTQKTENLNIAGQQAYWKSLRNSSGVFDVLCVALPHKVPPVIINSRIDGTDAFSNSFSNAVELDMNEQVSKYFKLYTVPGVELEVYQLLTPDTLWQLLVELDSCDVQLTGNSLLFVWPAYLRTDSIFSGRAKHIEKFSKSLIGNLHHDSEIKDELIPKNRRLLLNNLRSMSAPSLVIACGISLATGIFAIVSGVKDHNMFYVINSGLYAVIVFLPALLVGVSIMFSFVLFLISFRTARYTSRTLANLPKIKQYVTYYEGREL